MALKGVRDENGTIVDLEYVFTNQQTLKSVNRSSLVGKRFLQEFPEVLEHTDLFQRYCAVIETGTPWVDTVHIDFGGFTDVWAHVSAVRWEDCCLVTYNDVTVQVRSEQKIKEQAHFIEGISKAVPDLLTLIEFPERQTIYFNHDPHILTGYTLEEIKDLNLQERMVLLVHTDDRSRIHDFYNKLAGLQANQVAEMEYRLLTKQGNFSWIHARGIPYQFQDGNVTQALIISRDITSQKKNDGELQERRLLVEEVFKAIPDLITIQDCTTRKIVYTNNPKYWDQHTKGDGTLYTLPDVAHINQSVHPDHIDRVRKFLEDRLSLQGDETMELEFKMLKGHWIKSRSKVFKRDEHGQPSQILTVSYDITDAKLAEEQVTNNKELLQSIIDAPSLGLAVYKAVRNNEGQIIDFVHEFVNASTRKVVGDGFVGKFLSDHGENGTRQLDKFIKTIETNSVVAYVEHTGFGGSAHWISFSNSPLGGDRLVHIWEDITALVESADLKLANTKLREFDLAKTKFFSNVSHEFRTPLTLLLGPLSDLAEDQSIAPAQREKLVMAKRNASRLQKLVNALLDFSRFEAGQEDAIYQPTDIAKVTTELAGNFRSIVESAGLKLVVQCEDPGEPVYLNRQMYEKILLNLLSNAFKFTLKGKIEVKVRNKLKKVELRITDTGIGIAPNQQDRIFERFNRVEGKHARTFEGSGIGLALVKEMVKMHGGTIKLKSSPGEGSTFTATFLKGKKHLPPAKIFESNDAIAERAVDTYVEEASGWLFKPEKSGTRRITGSDSRPTVLVADDNADMRAYLADTLQRHFNILKVDNGKKAWDAMKAGFLPDLVLADVMMPDMDGYELLEAIRNSETFQHIPVILLSARSDEGSRIEGLRSGADDYLVKPFSSRELVARVDARIQISKLQEKVRSSGMASPMGDDLQATNESLRRKNEDLVKANRGLADMSNVVNHVLKEPLRKLSVFTQMLARDEGEHLSEGGRSLLSKIELFIDTMNDQLAEIAAYSTISAGVNNIAEVHVKNIFESCCSSLREVIVQKHGVVEHDIHGNLSADGAQVGYLLRNLMLNALMLHHPSRPPHLLVTGKVMAGDKLSHEAVNRQQQYYELAVHDNGIGFDQKFEKEIFELFRTSDHRAVYPVSGISLTLCKRIVENHGGFMIVSSRPGEGSTFCCYFPVNAKVAIL